MAAILGRGMRGIQTTHNFGMSVLVIEGHGEYHAGDNPQDIRIPDSTELLLFTDLGVGLHDAHGVAIATKKGVPASLPVLYDALNQEYDTNPNGAKNVAASGSLKYFRAGDKYPNLRLYPYDHPNMAQINVTQGSFCFRYDQNNPNKYILLSDIIAQCGPQQYKWAACTVFR